MAREGKWLSKVRRIFACGGKSSSNDSGKRTIQERRGRRKLKHGERNSFLSLFKEPTSSIEKILEDAETGQVLEQPKKATIELPGTASPKASPSCSVSPKFYTPKSATPRVLSPKAISPRARSARVAIPSARSSARVAIPSARSSEEGSAGDVSAGSPKIPSHVAILTKARSAATYASQTPRSSRPSFSKAANYKGIHREESVFRTEPVFPYHHVAATKIQATYRGYKLRTSAGSARGLVRLQRFVRGQSAKRQTDNFTKQMQLLVRVRSQLQSHSFQILECDALQQHERRLVDRKTESITLDAGNNGGWDDSILSKSEKEARNKRKDAIVRNKERAKTLLQSHQMSKFSSDVAGNSLMNPHIDALQWSWNWSEPHLHNAKKKVSMAPRRDQYLTPRNYSQSPTPSRLSQVQTPDRTPRSRYTSPSPRLHSKYSKPALRRSQSPSESLRSCPVYSVPRYMTPTASARAKMRLSDNFIESKRRLSYPLTPCSGTSKGGLFQDSDASSQRTVGTNHSFRSTSNVIACTPGSFSDGRKPFNRFV